MILSGVRRGLTPAARERHLPTSQKLSSAGALGSAGDSRTGGLPLQGRPDNRFRLTAIFDRAD